jgi:hypothetical protein
MSRDRKVMVTIGAAVILILIGLALYGWLSGAWEVPT